MEDKVLVNIEYQLCEQLSILTPSRLFNTSIALTALGYIIILA